MRTELAVEVSGKDVLCRVAQLLPSGVDSAECFAAVLCGFVLSRYTSWEHNLVKPSVSSRRLIDGVLFLFEEDFADGVLRLGRVHDGVMREWWWYVLARDGEGGYRAYSIQEFTRLRYSVGGSKSVWVPERR